MLSHQIFFSVVNESSKGAEIALRHKEGEVLGVEKCIQRILVAQADHSQEELMATLIASQEVLRSKGDNFLLFLS